MARPRPDAAGDAEFEFEAEPEENDEIFLADDDSPASICSDDSGYERWLAINASPIDLVHDFGQSKSADGKCPDKQSLPEAEKVGARVESVNALSEEKEFLEQALFRAESKLQEKILEVELLEEENDLLTKQVHEKQSNCENVTETVRLKGEEQDCLLQALQQNAADAIARAEKAESDCDILAKSLEDKELEGALLVDRAKQEKDLLNEELQQKTEELALLTKTLETSKESLSRQVTDHEMLLETLKEELNAEKELIDEELQQKKAELQLLSERFSAEKAALIATQQQQNIQAQADQFEVNALLEVKDAEIGTLLERQTRMEQEMRKFEFQKADMTTELTNARGAHDESNNRHRKLYAELCDLFELMEAKPSDDKRIPGSFPEESSQSSISTSKGSSWKWPAVARQAGELDVDDMLTMMTKRLLHLLDREGLCEVFEKELIESRDHASLADAELQQLKDEFKRFRGNADAMRNDLRGQSLQAESQLQDLQDMISQIVAEHEIEKMAFLDEKEKAVNRLKQFEAQYARLTNERADLGRESDKRMDKLRKENQSMQEEVRRAGLLRVEVTEKYERDANKLRQKMQEEDRRANLQRGELTEKHDRAQKESERVNKQLHDELDKKDAEIKTLKQQTYLQGYSYSSAPTSTTRRTGKGICQICFKPECPLGDSFSYYA